MQNKVVEFIYTSDGSYRLSKKSAVVGLDLLANHRLCFPTLNHKVPLLFRAAVNRIVGLLSHSRRSVQ